jgi:hypothetical protein
MKHHETPKSSLQQIALGSSIAVAATAIISLVIGIWHYNRNVETQVQLAALAALQNYLNLAVQYPDLASHDDGRPVDVRYAWFAAYALNTSQTIYVLVGHQASWQRAISRIIRQHQTYLRSGLFECQDFNPDFTGYLREKVVDVRCAQHGEAE